MKFNCKYRVIITTNNFTKKEYHFDDIQECIARYEIEMREDHDDLMDYCIVVQFRNSLNSWDTLVYFHCAVDLVNVLLKSS